MYAMFRQIWLLIISTAYFQFSTEYIEISVESLVDSPLSVVYRDHSDVLTVCDWNQKLSFYQLNGKQVTTNSLPTTHTTPTPHTLTLPPHYTYSHTHTTPTPHTLTHSHTPHTHTLTRTTPTPHTHAHTTYVHSQVGKDRTLGYDPTCVTYFPSGDFSIISGSHSKVSCCGSSN